MLGEGLAGDRNGGEGDVVVDVWQTSLVTLLKGVEAVEWRMEDGGAGVTGILRLRPDAELQRARR